MNFLAPVRCVTPLALLAGASLAFLSCSSSPAPEPPPAGARLPSRVVAEGCPAGAVPPTAPGLRSIRERLRNAVVADSAVSVSIAVLAGNRLVWSEAFGLAERERGIRATSATPYAIASVTKPVTAAAVLRLVDGGSVELDRPVNAYLGEAGLRGPEDRADDVTVRDLLRHRGGLPSHFHFIYTDEDYRRPAMDETIRRYGVVMYPPGKQSVYSNLGFGILERLIEKVDGRSYATFVEEEVFGQLGIEDAWMGPPGDHGCDPAESYAFDGERLPPYDFDHRGASVVFATAAAMARFGAAHFERPAADLEGLVSPEMLTAIRMDPVIDPDGRSRGLGWTIRQHATGHVLVEHSGGMPGALSMLRVAPKAGLSVFAVSNSETSGLPGMVSAAVLDSLLPAAPRPEIREASPEEAGSRPGEPAVKPQDLAGRWCGTLHTWQESRPVELQISGHGDSASIAWPGRTDAVTVEDLRLRASGRLTGRADVMIDTPDAGRSPHYVQLDLRLHQNQLSGAAIAMAVPPYAERVHYGLPSHLRLERRCVASG